MVKNIIPALAIVILLASCSNLKPLASVSSKPAATVQANETSKQVKFLDNISATNEAPAVKVEPAVQKNNKKTSTEVVMIAKNDAPVVDNTFVASSNTSAVEKASGLQFKYALLLNTEVEYVQNISLYSNIDEWYGTRYKLGGTTKNGIDCSAFVQTIFLGAFGIALPRTARDQYKSTRRISRTELQEGDLLFFNTRGGVSHVGIYLQNNKFVHASVSGGVTISDMFEPYYVRKFIGAGRIEHTASTSATF